MQKQPYPILTNHTLIDTHCHLDMKNYTDDFDTVLAKAKENHVCHIITIGIDVKSSIAAVGLAQKHSNISAAIGIHPHDVGGASEQAYNTLKDLYQNNQEVIVGFGEIGLDYFKNHAPVPLQKEHLDKQIEIAKALKLPIIIHCRDANDDILKHLHKHAPFPHGGVIHCFSGDINFARAVLDLGFYISIPGIVTFKNAKGLQEIAKEIPLNRILIESDGPFLSPMPYRGKRNEPAYVLYTANKIAQLRETTLEQIAEHTSLNAKTLFNLHI